MVKYRKISRESVCVLWNVLALEAWIEEEMRTRHVPGLAVAVIQEGEVVYARGFSVTGLGDIEPTY